MKNIVDTCPFAYQLDRSDTPLRRWARRLFAQHRPPFFTCEAVLTEAAYLTSPEVIARMVKAGDLVVEFSLQ